MFVVTVGLDDIIGLGIFALCLVILGIWFIFDRISNR